jgi:hypothetical protein
MSDDWWIEDDVPIARDEPEECDDGWHFAREEPTAPCPTCGDAS